MKHAHIIPLAGGQVIGTEMALKTKPEYLASWEVFAGNDQWCRKYYPNVPFHIIDSPDFKFSKLPKVDLLTCTPPCSGLSNATTGTRGCQAPQNEHMINVAEFGMQAGTKVILIENAPMLYSIGGYEFFVRFVPLARKYGYTMQLFKTSTILHGLPQNRVRSFVILWKGKKQPILNYIEEPYVPLTKWKNEGKNFVYPGKGSDDELVGLLYNIFGSRAELYKHIDRPRTAFGLAMELGLLHYNFKEPRYKKLFDRAKHKAVLDVTPVFVKDFTNALMWKVTTYMLSPRLDRFISIRELMSMMGLPEDYEEVPRRGMNIIFQNVPTCTTKTIVEEIQQVLDGKRKWKTLPFSRVNNIKKEIESKAYTYESLLIN